MVLLFSGVDIALRRLACYISQTIEQEYVRGAKVPGGIAVILANGARQFSISR
jgi:hypothetical protein